MILYVRIVSIYHKSDIFRHYQVPPIPAEPNCARLQQTLHFQLVVPEGLEPRMGVSMVMGYQKRVGL